MGKTAKRALTLIEKAKEKGFFINGFIDRKNLYNVFCDPTFDFGADSESVFNSAIFWLKAQNILADKSNKGFHLDEENYKTLKEKFKVD